MGWKYALMSYSVQVQMWLHNGLGWVHSRQITYH